MKKSDKTGKVSSILQGRNRIVYLLSISVPMKQEKLFLYINYEDRLNFISIEDFLSGGTTANKRKTERSLVWAGILILAFDEMNFLAQTFFYGT